jgi:ERCC4-type nuclease
MIILVDTREKNEHRFEFSSFADENTSVKFQKLDIGDYAIDGLDDLCIERKGSVSELIRNLTNKEDSVRFAKELEKLANKKYAYLILCFSLEDLLKGARFSTVSPNYILSLLLEIQCKYNLYVLFGAENSEFLIYKILKKHWDLMNGSKRWKH